MATKNRSSSEAYKLLQDYEDLNQDLPEETRRQMGMFAIAHRVGAQALNTLFDGVGQTPFRHRAWFWWNCLRTAGLGKHWRRVAAAKNDGKPLSDVLYDLRDRVGEEDWEALSRRFGTPVLEEDDLLDPGRWSESNPGVVWTKGGSWQRQNPMTRILVLKEHLAERTPEGHRWCRLLGEDGCEKIERELHGLIDPDKMLAPRAKRRAVEYVRKRIPEIIGMTNSGNASYRTAAWFFQTRIWDPEGWIYEPEMAVPDSSKRQRPFRHSEYGREVRWEWLP